MEHLPGQAENRQWISDINPSFLRHAHRRIFRLGTRCKRLCKNGWDINLVAVLHNDTATLAGQCGNAGLIDESHALHQLEKMLERFLTEQRLPSREELDNIAEQCDRLLKLESEQALDLTVQEPDVDSPAATTPSSSAPVNENMKQASHPAAPGPAISPLPDALLLKLPRERWLDISQTSSDDNDSPIAPSQASEKTAAGPVIIICQPDRFSTAFLQSLQEAGVATEHSEDWDQALTLAEQKNSTVIILPAGLESDPAAIKDAVQQYNQGQKQPVHLVAVGQSSEISERVRAMRMGAKRYFTEETPIEEIVTALDALRGEEPSEKPRVLVVDDDESQARFAQSVLEKAGLNAKSITRPMEALEILEQFSPDLILMDLYMPEISGAELTSLIRENERFLGTPIVFLSGEQDEERQFEALQMGGDDFLEKPIKPKHLIAAVQTRIQRSRKLKARVEAHPEAPSTSNSRLAMIDQLNAMLDEAVLEKRAFAYLTLKNRIHFKENLGYQHLDEGMEKLLQWIRKHAPDGCTVARFGEFNFALLCSDQHRDALPHMLEQLCQKAQALNLQTSGAEPLHPQLATGLAWLEDNPRDAARIIAQAEKAAHLAMESGQLIHQATPLTQQQKPDKNEQHVLELIRQSLEEESLQLLFQPLINLNDNSQEQYQTLLRLMTPEQDFIPAARFIPVAEKHGLIPRLDRWVMKRAMDTLSHRCRLNRPLRLFVNQSIQSWTQGDMTDWLLEHLQQAAFKGNLLCIEFSCTQMGPEWLSDFAPHLQRLRQEGIQISLARFDGENEHKQLAEQMKPDYIKLDAIVVQDAVWIQQLPEVVEWAHQRGSKLIIPRVEQAMDAANFWTSGVDFLQGNFIQSPDSKLQFDFQGSAF